MPNDQYRERHLPHQVPSGFPIFLNWNLKGAVPKAVIEELERETERLSVSPAREGECERDRKIRHAKLLFVQRDASLDQDSNSYCQSNRKDSFTFDGRPMWLADPEAADEVVKSFLWGVGVRYRLWSFVVMGNHVHGLLTPDVDLEKITQGIKGFTAYQINKLQRATGRTFWQDESFDHYARDDHEFYRIIEYIEQNPVVAGLCQTPEQWKWSSAAMRDEFGWKRGEAFAVDRKDDAVQWLKRTSGFPA